MIGMKIEIFVPMSIERGIGVDKLHAGIEAGGDILKLGLLRCGGAAIEFRQPEFDGGGDDEVVDPHLGSNLRFVAVDSLSIPLAHAVPAAENLISGILVDDNRAVADPGFHLFAGCGFGALGRSGAFLRGRGNRRRLGSNGRGDGNRSVVGLCIVNFDLVEADAAQIGERA